VTDDMMGIDVPVNTRSDVLGLNLVHHQHGIAMISAAFCAHGNWTGHYSWGQLTHQMTESTERPRRSHTDHDSRTDWPLGHHDWPVLRARHSGTAGSQRRAFDQTTWFIAPYTF